MEIRRKSLAVLLGISIAGIVGASAASLNLTSSSLGADAKIVAACDADGITVNYSANYDAVAQAYRLGSVNFSNVDAACDGKAYSVTLDGALISPVTVTGTVALGGGSAFSVSFAGVDPEQVDNLAVVISG